MFDMLFDVTCKGLACLALFSIATHLIPVLFMYYRKPQDLKKRYDAKWALVTGGSSGIGLAIVERLAAQGLNVVVPSLDDDLLKDSVARLQKEYPTQEFRAVGVNMSPGSDYFEKIVEATKDVEVQILFNNAGYIVTGFFDQTPLDRQMANMECNATAAARLTHHFVARMVAAKLPGCVVFTSSAAAAIPSPFSCMYGATKAFVSQFAASLAVEVRSRGIDVVSVHPSPVASRFYEKTHKLEMLDLAKMTAVKPEVMPDEIFKSVGGCHWRDIGLFAMLVRWGMACVNYDVVILAFSSIAHFLPDFKKYNKSR